MDGKKMEIMSNSNFSKSTSESVSDNKVDRDIRNAFILSCFGLLPMFLLCFKSFLELLLKLGVLK
jgi:hypothetical protein